MSRLRLINVREHAEGYPVVMDTDEGSGRLVIVARNEGGHNQTAVDVIDLMKWVVLYRPQLIPTVRYLAKCPACESMGDAEHLAACAGAAISRSWRAGGSHVIAMVEKMIARRKMAGPRDVKALRAGLEHVTTRTVWDAFCGIGAWASRMARRVKR